MSRDVCLRTVARLANHTHFDVSRRDAAVRKGPFPYYGELFERFEIDDCGIDAPSVVFVCAAGRVLDADGAFRASLEHGRCGAGAFAHVLVPHDANDADYLLACLTTLPEAVDYIGGSNHLQTLDELALLRIAVPWPCPQTRAAYVERLAAANDLVSRTKQGLLDAQAALEAAAASTAPAPELAALEAAADTANRDHVAAVKARAALARGYMELGVLDGCDCTPTEPPRVEGLYHYSDDKTQRAKEELRSLAARQAAEKGGLPMTPALSCALGPLRDLVERRSFGLAPTDLAWELAPLAVLRAALPAARWLACVEAARGQGDVVEAVDAALVHLSQADPCFSLLPNLSYASSLLAADQLAQWLLDLDAVDPAAVTPKAVRAVLDVAFGAPAVPAAVSTIAAAVARARLKPGDAVYLPDVYGSGLFEVPTEASPSSPVYAQCENNASLLSLLLVRGVAKAQGSETAPLNACSPGSPALVHDCHPGLAARFALCDVRPSQGPWSPTPVDTADPRWVLGAPTRMRSTYAWVQQALCHLGPDGLAVVLAPSKALLTTASVDVENRRNLVEQRRVLAAVALPARIWGDGREPASLLVLGSAGAAPSCLIVDATALDSWTDDAVFGPDPQRTLRGGAVRNVAQALTSWLQDGDPGDCAAGHARVVSATELEANGCLLAPWLYVRARPAAAR